MKSTIIWIVICVLTLLCGFQLGFMISGKKYEKKLDEVINIYTTDDETAEYTPSFHEGLQLDSTNCKIYDIHGNDIAVGTLSAPKNICARFSATGCRPCIDTLTESLKAFSKSNPDWHINLLIDNIALRDIYVLSKEYGPSFSLYSTDDTNIDLGSSISPIIFCLSPDKKIYRHFTCAPDAPERTKAYVESIIY